MNMIRSIKHQAIALFVSFTIGLTLLYLGLAVIASFVVEDNIIYRLLKFEANHIEHTYSETGRLPPARMSFIQVFATKDDLPEFAKAAMAKGLHDNEIFTPGEQHFHLKKLQLGNDKVGYLLAEVSPLLTVTNSPGIFELFIWALGLTLVIAIVLAYKMASLTVKPVMAMTQAVKAKRPLPKLKHELGYLSQTMQNAFDDLQQTLQREKDFTTDVSHELRTPLTVLNNAVALVEQRGFQDGDLTQLKQVASDMQHTVDVLLALARQESVNTQVCMLKSMVEQTGMTCALAAKVELDLHIDMAEDFTVTANSSLLALLLTNLVNNAISHGSNKQLWVTGAASQLRFHNMTKQMPPQDAACSGIKGANSNGIGQGLYLVTRIIEALGWQHQLRLTDTQFCIEISL